MIFGTKLPFEFAEEVVAVGNSANAAVSAARIGLTSGLVAHIGKDENGEKCIRQLEKEGVSTKFIGVHEGLHTNYHYVLWFGSERTILIKHEDFPLTLPDIGNPKWLYLSSLGEHSMEFHNQLSEYLSKNPDINLVFQPGTYQIKFGTEKLSKIYARTNLFFCNLEESQIILKNDTKDIKTLLDGLRALGPKLPVITDGPHGSYTYIKDESGEEYVAGLDIYPDIVPPVERTGAGDAFASTFSSAIALGKSVETALKWGSINSMSVCQKVGAQAGLLSQNEIEHYMLTAPKDWGIKKIS
jgi:ribokinase